MLLKIVNGFSQAAIIILALVLIVTITNKHTSNLALEDFQSQVNSRFDEDKKYYDLKIKTVQDNLNTYQMTREARAQLYSKRLDELYDLYKKDPSPIVNASTPKPLDLIVEHPIDKNFTYLEQRINKVDEKADTNNNKLESRLNILEQRVSNHTSNRSESVKVIQTNLQTVNNGKIEQ